MRTVAGRLGHRNAATTLNVYSHFVPEADRHAAQSLPLSERTSSAERSDVRDLLGVATHGEEH